VKAPGPAPAATPRGELAPQVQGHAGQKRRSKAASAAASAAASQVAAAGNTTRTSPRGPRPPPARRPPRARAKPGKRQPQPHQHVAGLEPPVRARRLSRDAGQHRVRAAEGHARRATEELSQPPERRVEPAPPPGGHERKPPRGEPRKCNAQRSPARRAHVLRAAGLSRPRRRAESGAVQESARCMRAIRPAGPPKLIQPRTHQEPSVSRRDGAQAGGRRYQSASAAALSPGAGLRLKR
jgi:hypothetical protein